MVGRMLNQVMLAYAHDNVDLARVSRPPGRRGRRALRPGLRADHGPDGAEPAAREKVEATYEVLRVARELERFGDLATNVAERIIYLVTGSFEEINVDKDDSTQ